MAFGLRETSRADASPVKLFLFKGTDPTAESLVRSITMIPGATEFGYGVTPVDKTWVDEISETISIDRSEPLNRIAGNEVTDFVQSVKDLLATFPYLQHVSLVVTWFGTDLRCGNCTVIPKVGEESLTTSPYSWRVGNLDRASAEATSIFTNVEIPGGDPTYESILDAILDILSGDAYVKAFGGTPSDRSVYEAIQYLRAAGLRVTLYPFVMMDIPEDNALPDPYGAAEQAQYPWRGRITCHPAAGQPGTVQGASAAADQVADFFGDHDPADFGWDATNLAVDYSGPANWSYERFILHMATLAAAAGANDFLIGSEMVGLTRVRGAGVNNYPAVTHLKTLAAKARTIVGEDVRISYAADWSEYHSDQYGSNLCFNLDPLWSDTNIDFIGIDNYFPLSDWREGKTHRDWWDGYTSNYDLFYLKKNVEGGEYFDWYYASESDRDAQVRTPITDGAHSKPWVFRQKDMRSWWSNPHINRIDGEEVGTATDWVAESKPIVFTELGCPAVEKGSNQPNVFYDPKSAESALPHYSNGRPDAAIQRVFLEASLDYWRPGNGNNEDGMIEWNSASVWTWDARPYPTFPNRTSYYGDAPNWRFGHWLTGRMVPGRAFESGTFGPYAFTDGETAIERAGITFEPWPIKHSDIESSGDLDKSTLTVSLANRGDLMGEFNAFPPSQVINLTIFQGHAEDPVSLTNHPAIWLGRVSAPEIEGNELRFACTPVSTTIQRPGLRRNYQLGCPHVLYGPQCQASKAAATVEAVVASMAGSMVTLEETLGTGFANFIGGTLEWMRSTGQREIRTILNTNFDGTTLAIRGGLRGLTVGATVYAALGCPRNMSGCISLHNNILNFGGQPFIPLDNPLSQKVQFY